MTKKEVLVKAVRSDGQEFEYNNDDWGLTGLSGIDFIPVEVFRSNKGFGDGSYITGKRKTERDMQIISVNRNRKDNELQRYKCIGFHNPDFTFDLYFTYMGQTRIAKECEILDQKLPSGNVYDSVTLTIDFLCAEPDFYGTSGSNIDFKSITKLWHVSRAYTSGSTQPYSVSTATHAANIYYGGTADAPMVVTVTATGAVPNITVTVNGAEITYNDSLASGDVLIIDGQKQIAKKNGTVIYSAGGTIIRNLDKCKLHYGDNTIAITDSTGSNAYTVAADYTGRYGGL